MTASAAARRCVAVAALVAAAAAVAALPAAGGTAARGTGGAATYRLYIVVSGEAHWAAAGRTPISPEEGSIDTAAGFATARFQGTGTFTITLDSSLRFSSLLNPLDITAFGPLASGRLTGSWDGTTGDAPDAKGHYSCSYNVDAAALPKADLRWYIDGRKRLDDGAVHLSIVPTQPADQTVNDPLPTCTGYKSNHERPGEYEHITPGAFSGEIVEYERALVLAKIPVKPLLATLRRKVPIRIAKADIAHGEGCGCGLAVLPTDLSSFSLTIKARLFPAKR